MQDTFDVFFSYHRRDRAAVDRIARALIERGLSVFLDRWYLAAGQPWPQALEAALARCRAVAIFLGPEGLSPWQQREKDLALDRQGREPAFPVIPVLLARSDPGLGFLRLNTWVDFSADGQADPHTIEILIAAIRGEPAGPEAGRRIESARATICPYRGLRPFREEDEPFFFGRAAFTETLTTTLACQSFVAVVGASGSGKSSVVRAGLIPRLRRGEGGRIWEAVSFVPTDRPLASLAASLLPLLEPDLTEVDRLTEVGKLARHLAEGDVRLRDMTSRILEKQPGTKRLLLFADKWGELYTLCPDEAIRTAFVAQLLEVAQSAAVTVVLALRGDFMGHALANRALSDRLQDSIVTIGPMTRNELAETIIRPAEKMGLAFEPGLVETILDDVGDEPGNLPLLEFLLEALWNERRGALLHYDAYQKLGRVAGAIAHRADEVFMRELDGNQRQAAQRLLIRMVRPGEGVEDTRQRAAMPVADPVAETTIRKLADARLVVTERDAVSGRETVEVAHEALIRRWQRLRGWVDQDREFLRTRERIAAHARLWEEEDKPPDRLLPPGRPLVEGQDLLAMLHAGLDADLIAYIESSIKKERFTFLERLGVKRIGDKLMKAMEEYRRLDNEMAELGRKRTELETKIKAARAKMDESIPFIFISYAREDEDSAYRIYNQLTTEGFNVWMDKKDLLPGQDWDYKIRKTMEKSDFIILCLSQKSVNKRGYVQKEMKMAMDIFREMPSGSVFLIPVIINHCEVPDEISRYHYIYFNRDDAIQMIFRSIAEEVGRRATSGS